MIYYDSILSFILKLTLKCVKEIYYFKINYDFLVTYVIWKTIFNKKAIRLYNIIF